MRHLCAKHGEKKSMEIRIAPSLLAADFAHLAEEVHRAEAAKADLLHLDIMDGHFVPNLTFGPALVAAIRPLSALHFDVHLMVDNPERFLEPFAEAGADGLTIHVEAAADPAALLARIGRLGKCRGLSLNPDTPIARLTPYLACVDRILLMSVFPGFGGQKFIPSSLERLRELRTLVGEREIEIQVDGGIYAENAAAIWEAGATTLVVGTGTFRTPDMAEAIRHLRACHPRQHAAK
ncbi:MAG: ribulose-phosphate 3-epimerase [Planctomycetota bacterium]|nr:ribulose-phosphate 3-epimerase [Planctomycetota bacterium]